MNAEHTNTGHGNWIVFLLGAVYNILAGLNLSTLVEHSVKMVIGGLAFLLVKALVDKLTPLFQKWLKKLSDFFKGE